MSRSLNWFSSRFPDSLYPCIPEKQTEYVERVLTGYEIASRSSVCIAGLARNCESVLPWTLARIDALGKFFFDASFCILENDSIDSTANILINWANNRDDIFLRNHTFGFHNHGSVKTDSRISNMAYCRNYLKGIIELIYTDDEPDYVILLDMDIEGGFSTEGILNSLSYPYDCLASNSLIYTEQDGKKVRHYYDSYGLKFKNDISDEDKNMLLYHRGESPVMVDSAFGGLAVYRYRPYINGKYSVPDASKYCEHIPFHSSMECYINPSQITLYSKSRYSI